MKKGRIFVISAPSGCGKTTLCNRLLKKGLGLSPSISVTTRPRREGEADGKDYFFVASKEFLKRVSQKGFLEWTRTFGWFYGTPCKSVEMLLRKGKDILLSIDVKGAMQIERLYPDSILIFILPPSLGALKDRLRKRKADDKREIDKRLRIAKKEIARSVKYDYTVVNDSVRKAVDKLESIVIAERCKTKQK